MFYGLSQLILTLPSKLVPPVAQPHVKCPADVCVCVCNLLETLSHIHGSGKVGQKILLFLHL